MTTGHRTLADQLRSWPPDRLLRLLQARPDLATPAPQDSGQLASRAATRSSLVRALDQLNRFELSVLDSLCTPNQTYPSVTSQDPDATTTHLVDLALVWESTAGLRVLNGVHELLTPLDVPPERPALATAERDQALVDRAAAGAAFEAVRRTEVLLDLWGSAPPPVLRSGGLGVRDLRAAAAALDVEEAHAALLAEVAVAAGLATASGTAWMPTDAFDAWSGASYASRWETLVDAWLVSPRMPALVGQRDTAGRVWNALVPEITGVHMAESRRMTLAALRSLPRGEVLAAGTGGPSVLAQIAWERPRRPRTRGEQVAWTLSEAEMLGVTALGGLATYARAWLDGSLKGLAELLPSPVSEVLLQADLTAVAPGPLESDLARRLGQLADVESRGGATTYRFTPTSMRRALDLGWTAVELHAFLSSVSRTPVPQPLSYLVDDVARTHGTLRVGYAEAFLRADDEHALTELLHHPRAAELGLRRLAPTVLVSDVPIDLLVTLLREVGAAPLVEKADGTVHVGGPSAARARTPRRPAPASAEARAAAQAAAVVTAIRAGDQVATLRPAAEVTPAGALALLRSAIDSRSSVVITYVDNHGTRSDRLVTPMSVADGQLTAHDHRADDVRRFAVHRIRTVRPS